MTADTKLLWGLLPRRGVKKNDMEEAAKSLSLIVASVRKAGRVRNRDDLPTYRAVISQNYGVTGNDLSFVAALDLGNRAVMLLVSENHLGMRLHLDLRRKVIEAGYRLTDERLADISLIASTNKAINRESADAKASDVLPIVSELIRDAVSEMATDIHLCCRESSGMALFRIHSRLYTYRNFEVLTCEQIAGYMYTQMADERSRSIGTFSLENKSMSCMIRTSVGSTKYKLRYKFIRLADGWDVVIRILPIETAGSKSKTFEELGYEVSQVRQLERAVSKSIGFIALTGPTGAGKSTTLKCAMEFDPNRRFRKRYGVEDPVEYKIFQVSQISVQRDDHEGEDENHKALNGVLRDILRGDPDEIMIGETRDRSTANIVADFVLTGHKLYTTLHTSSAYGAVLRLSRLGLDRHILADRQFLSAIAFQRLLPVLCSDCKVPASKVLLEDKLNLLSVRFGLNVDDIYCSSDKGCERCRHRGITGSTVVAEILSFDKVTRNFIADGRDDKAEEYWRQSRRTAFDDPDMTGKTAFEHALYKISKGMIDPRDLESEFEPLDSYELVEATQ